MKHTTAESHKIMTAALALCRAVNSGKIPAGRNAVSVNSVYVSIYGIGPLRTIVSVQYTADGVGYSADVGKKSGKLGKVSNFNP